MSDYTSRWFSRPQAVTHPSTNRSQRKYVDLDQRITAKPRHNPLVPL